MGCPALQAGRSGASSTDWARRLSATAGSLKGTLPPTTPYHRALTMINLTSKGGGCQTGRYTPFPVGGLEGEEVGVGVG